MLSHTSNLRLANLILYKRLITILLPLAHVSCTGNNNQTKPQPIKTAEIVNFDEIYGFSSWELKIFWIISQRQAFWLTRTFLNKKKLNKKSSGKLGFINFVEFVGGMSVTGGKQVIDDLNLQTSNWQFSWI